QMLEVDIEAVEAGGAGDAGDLDAAHEAHRHRCDHLVPLELFLDAVAQDVRLAHVPFSWPRRPRYAFTAGGEKRPRMWGAGTDRGLRKNYRPDFKSIRHDVSPEEWQARVALAACYRLVDKYGMTDLIYNHITARIPGSDDHLLINLYGLLYKEITASSLVRINLDGDILWKPETDYGINKSGYVIPAALHRARP